MAYTCFLSYVEDGAKKQTYTQKQILLHTNSYVEHVCNSGTTLWKSGKERRERNDRASTIM
jgi:hypothetical protein